jgi:Skp family chaperone for outer membrane proteins
VVAAVACVWSGAAKAGDEPDPKQALAVCDQLRSTLAQTTTELVETKQELAETKERLAKLEEAVAKMTAEGKGSGSDDGKRKYTKVAVVNMAKVMLDYKKVAENRKQYERKKEELDKEAKDLLGEIARINSLAPSGYEPLDSQELIEAKKVDQELRSRLTAKIEELDRALKDFEDTALCGVMKEIEAAAQIYAHSRDIDLVLYYTRGVEHATDEGQRVTIMRSHGFWEHDSDSTEILDKYDAKELPEKMRSSGLPLYAGRDVDITDDIIHVLNWNYSESHHGHK